MGDLRLGVDPLGLHEPLVDGGGDVADGGVDPAGEVGGVETSRLTPDRKT
ncbi:hypothetical protein [Streptomyces sp. NBC_01530]